MLVISADANGVIQAGQIVDIDDKEAIDLVKGGYAISIDPIKEPEKSDIKGVEKNGRRSKANSK